MAKLTQEIQAVGADTIKQRQVSPDTSKAFAIETLGGMAVEAEKGHFLAKAEDELEQERDQFISDQDQVLKSAMGEMEKLRLGRMSGQLPSDAFEIRMEATLNKYKARRPGLTNEINAIGSEVMRSRKATLQTIRDTAKRKQNLEDYLTKQVYSDALDMGVDVENEEFGMVRDIVGDYNRAKQEVAEGELELRRQELTEEGARRTFAKYLPSKVHTVSLEINGLGSQLERSANMSSSDKILALRNQANKYKSELQTLRTGISQTPASVAFTQEQLNKYFSNIDDQVTLWEQKLQGKIDADTARNLSSMYMEQAKAGWLQKPELAEVVSFLNLLPPDAISSVIRAGALPKIGNDLAMAFAGGPVLPTADNAMVVTGKDSHIKAPTKQAEQLTNEGTMLKAWAASFDTNPGAWVNNNHDALVNKLAEEGIADRIPDESTRLTFDRAMDVFIGGSVHPQMAEEFKALEKTVVPGTTVQGRVEFDNLREHLRAEVVGDTLRFTNVSDPSAVPELQSNINATVRRLNTTFANRLKKVAQAKANISGTSSEQEMNKLWQDFVTDYGVAPAAPEQDDTSDTTDVSGDQQSFNMSPSEVEEYKALEGLEELKAIKEQFPDATLDEIKEFIATRG